MKKMYNAPNQLRCLLVLVFLFLMTTGCSKNAAMPAKDDSDDDVNGGGISFEEQRRLLPIPPANVYVTRLAGSVSIVWAGPSRWGASKFLIYRRCSHSGWEYLTDVVAEQVSRVNAEYTYSIQGTATGCIFAVSTVDVYGKEGTKIEAAQP